MNRRAMFPRILLRTSDRLLWAYLDPNLGDLWISLFGVVPEASPDDRLTLRAPDQEVTWPAGQLEMGARSRLQARYTQ